MPILKNLPRGHRLYLSVDNNSSTYQNVLSANSKPITVDLDEVISADALKLYFAQGIQHIFVGFDHILFLLTLLLPGVLIIKNNQYPGYSKLMPALIDTFKIITAFTFAHSLTVGLAVFQFVQLPGRLVEPVIAFSIIACAINNLKPILPVSRWSLAFGFASVLAELGMESKKSLTPLIEFNLGIEAGQLAIVIIVLPVFYIIRNSMIFRIGIYKGGSVVSIMIASGWMLQRAF